MIVLPPPGFALFYLKIKTFTVHWASTTTGPQPQHRFLLSSTLPATRTRVMRVVWGHQVMDESRAQGQLAS